MSKHVVILDQDGEKDIENSHCARFSIRTMPLKNEDLGLASGNKYDAEFKASGDSAYPFIFVAKDKSVTINNVWSMKAEHGDFANKKSKNNENAFRKYVVNAQFQTVNDLMEILRNQRSSIGLKEKRVEEVPDIIENPKTVEEGRSGLAFRSRS